MHDFSAFRIVVSFYSVCSGRAIKSGDIIISGFDGNVSGIPTIDETERVCIHISKYFIPETEVSVLELQLLSYFF